MKMLPKKLNVIFAVLICAVGAFAQTSAPTPDDERKIAQMKQEIELLRQRQELEKIKNDISSAQLREITNALPKNSTVKPPDAETTFNEDKSAHVESIALSYEALRELTAQIGARMTRGAAARYSGMVIYYEPDFLALGKYRLYRNQSTLALKNYELVRQRLAKSDKSGEPGDGTTVGTRGGVNPLSAFLSLPSIATSYAESVAELFAVFRTETVLTQSADTIDGDALGVAVAGEFKKSNPNLRVYHPQSFVPEFDLNDDDDSLFARAARVRAAYFYLDALLAQAEKIPEARRDSGNLGETLALVKAVKNQLQGLTINESAATRGESGDVSRTTMPEFRQLVRAEKLDKFLRGGQTAARGASPPVGILKLRLLASGGSRKETRNLFLGSKVRYSGSAVLEIQLFDTDGNLQSSEIFSYHTGFRKMKADGKRL